MRPSSSATPRLRACFHAGLSLLLLGTALPTGLSARILPARTDEFILPEGDTSTNELWLAAENIEIAGTSTDDIYAVALQATLSGRFEEDLWILCRDTLSFSGRAENQVRVAATTVELAGHHQRSCIALGYSISATPESRFDTDVILIGDTLLFSGQALGDVVLAGTRATVQGRVEGDLYLLTHDASVLPGTRIGGNIHYLGERDLALSRQVDFDGEIKRIHAPWLSAPQTPLDRLRQGFNWLLASALAGFLLMLLFPDYTGRSVRAIRRTPARALLVGSLAILSVPLLLLLGLGSSVVRPLCFLLLAYLGILFYLARVVVALTLGGLLLRRRGLQTFRRAGEALGIGLLLLYLLGTTPIVGNVVLLLTLCFGGGGLLGSVLSRTMPPELPTQAGAGGAPQREENENSESIEGM